MSKLNTSIPTYQFEQNSEEIQEILNKVDKIESNVTNLSGKVNTITDDLKNETERRVAADITINNTIGNAYVLDSTNLVDEIINNGGAISNLSKTVSDVQKSIDEKIESPDIYTVEVNVPVDTEIELKDCYEGVLSDYTIYGSDFDTTYSHPGGTISKEDGTSVIVDATISPINPVRKLEIIVKDSKSNSIDSYPLLEEEDGYNLVRTDSINFLKGQVTKEYHYLELTGNETWRSPENMNLFYYSVEKVCLPQNPIGNASIADIQCSHFRTVPYNNMNGTSDYLDNSIAIPKSADWLAITYSSCSNVDSFKAWLKAQYEAGTPVKVAYKMEAPTTTQISLPEIKIPSGDCVVSIAEKTNNNGCDFKFSVHYKKNKIDSIKENLPNELIVTKEVEGGQLDISDAANEEIINLRVKGNHNESLVGTSEFWLNDTINDDDTIHQVNKVQLKFTKPLLLGDVFDYQSKTITRCRKKINFADYAWKKVDGKIGYYRTKSIKDMDRDDMQFEYCANITDWVSDIDSFFNIDSTDENIYFFIYDNSDTNSEYYNDIIIRHPNATTELAFQSWVQSASIDFIYVLASPIKEMYKPKTDDGELKAISFILKKGENVLRGNIGSDTCAPSHISVTYKADTKLYIDNKFEELQNAILSTGGNV